MQPYAAPTSIQEPTRPTPVVVQDIDMPFWSMVWFMLKWSVAAIPAALILGAVMSAIVVVTMMLLAAVGVVAGAAGH